MRSIAALPTLRDHRIDPGSLQEAAGASMLLALSPATVREAPCLSAIPGVLDALPERAYGGAAEARERVGQSLRSALAEGAQLWVGVMTADEVAEWRLCGAGDLLHEIGVRESGEAPSGRSTVPVALAPCALAERLTHLTGGLPALREWLRGVDTLRVPPALARTLIDDGVDVRDRSRAARWARNPRVLAYAVVFVYSALRALPVALVREFQGSLVVLWTIDILTAFPYTWGIIAAISGKRWWVRLAGLLVTIVTFVAPYVYFWLHGRDYPPFVVAVVIALIASGVLLEVVKYVRTARLERRLRAPRPRGSGQPRHRDRAPSAGR